MSNCYGHSSVVVCVPFYSVVLIGESWSWTQLLMSIFFLYFLLFHKLSLCIYDICFRVMGIGLTLLDWALNMCFTLGLLIIKASNFHLQKKWRRWLFIVCLIVISPCISKQPGFEKRRGLYMLYHYLNHYNLFGSGYRSSAMSIIDDYLWMLNA